MKKPFVRAELASGNETMLDTTLFKDDGPQYYYPLLAVLAQVSDLCVEGENVYVTFGITRDKTALLLTLKYDGVSAYASGQDLIEVSKSCQLLLSEAE